MSEAVTRAHRERAAKLVSPMVPDCWIDDPKDTHGLSRKEVQLLNMAAQALATFEAELRAELAKKPYVPVDHAVTGAIAFLRENWRNNDGAEGESVKLVCSELERLRAEPAAKADPAPERQGEDDGREVWVLESPEPTEAYHCAKGKPLAASPDREQLLRLGNNVHRYVPAPSAASARLIMARRIGAESWLNDDAHEHTRRFRAFYSYLSNKTNAIPACSACSPEDLYYVISFYENWLSRLRDGLEKGYEVPAPSAGESMAAWAVRCLDAWADAQPGRSQVPAPNRTECGDWFLWLSTGRYFSDVTPDAARIAAALALYAADNTLPAPPAPTLTNDNGRTR